MSRISIEVTDAQHKRLKALAALHGKSIKDFVLERTLGGLGGQSGAPLSAGDPAAYAELEALLDERIAEAEAVGEASQTATEVFEEVIRKIGDDSDR